VNGALLEAFRHNSWATRQLLAFSRDLSEDQFAASATSTHGSIRATFHHLVVSDGRYLRRLAGGAPAWVDRPDDADLHELAAWAEEAGQLWDREQISAILTSLGIEPPDIQPWAYAWATGRIWERTAAH
jgi:uncharacterized damage-inducible protein DinB